MIAFLFAASLFVEHGGHGVWPVDAPVANQVTVPQALPVHDDALVNPHDIVVRLQERYEDDPLSAIVLARRLGGMSDPQALQIFVDWIHTRLALDFAPVTTDRAKTPAHMAFLAALVEPGNPNGPMA